MNRLIHALDSAIVVLMGVVLVVLPVTLADAVNAPTAVAAPTVRVATVQAGAVTGPMIGCWTDPKPVADGGPEDICGDLDYADDDAQLFRPYGAAPYADDYVLMPGGQGAFAWSGTEWVVCPDSGFVSA